MYIHTYIVPTSQVRSTPYSVITASIDPGIHPSSWTEYGVLIPTSVLPTHRPSRATDTPGGTETTPTGRQADSQTNNSRPQPALSRKRSEKATLQPCTLHLAAGSWQLAKGCQVARLPAGPCLFHSIQALPGLAPTWVMRYVNVSLN